MQFWLVFLAALGLGIVNNTVLLDEATELVLAFIRLACVIGMMMMVWRRLDCTKYSKHWTWTMLLPLFFLITPIVVAFLPDAPEIN